MMIKFKKPGDFDAKWVGHKEWDELDKRYMKGFAYILIVWVMFAAIYLPTVVF